jgi:hypothetical protein
MEATTMTIHGRRLKSTVIMLILSLLLSSCSIDGGQGSAFRDDFEDPRSGWGADQRGEFARGYGGGEYFIDLHAPDWFAWANPGTSFDDVIVEVDAHLAAGSSDGHFGALCRYVDTGDFYYFAISADGYYAIFRRQSGGGLDVLTGDGSGMIFSPAIGREGQINRIRAVCQGNELSLYVNDELLDTVTDDAHSRGDVGVGAGSGFEGDVRILFDEFNATRP